jgi:hypothetical protein
MPLFQLSFVGSRYCRMETPVLSPSVKENYFPPSDDKWKYHLSNISTFSGEENCWNSITNFNLEDDFSWDCKENAFFPFFSKTRQFSKWCFRKNHIFHYFALETVFFLHIFKYFLGTNYNNRKIFSFLRKQCLKVDFRSIAAKFLFHSYFDLTSPMCTVHSHCMAHALSKMIHSMQKRQITTPLYE